MTIFIKFDVSWYINKHNTHKAITFQIYRINSQLSKKNKSKTSTLQVKF